MELGAKDFTLNIIEQNHKGDSEKCCKEMLHNWLNGKTDCGNCSRTWDGLLPVVETVVGSETSFFIRKKVLNWEEEGLEPMENEITESKFQLADFKATWFSVDIFAYDFKKD